MIVTTYTVQVVRKGYTTTVRLAQFGSAAVIKDFKSDTDAYRWIAEQIEMNEITSQTDDRMEFPK